VLIVIVVPKNNNLSVVNSYSFIVLYTCNSKISQHVKLLGSFTGLKYVKRRCPSQVGLGACSPGKILN